MRVKRFEETFAEQKPEVQARANALAEQMLRELALDELRAARQLSQDAIAKVLGVKQPAIAKIEKRTDMYISTLRNMIQAMGGTLDIIAHFPDGDVRIKQFAELDAQEHPTNVSTKRSRARKAATA
ncbi:MAG TPA: XRE family transcriptional regulator [Oscillatoriaceae cyanobacterium]